MVTKEVRVLGLGGESPGQHFLFSKALSGNWYLDLPADIFSCTHYYIVFCNCIKGRLWITLTSKNTRVRHASPGCNAQTATPAVPAEEEMVLWVESLKVTSLPSSVPACPEKAQGLKSRHGKKLLLPPTHSLCENSPLSTSRVKECWHWPCVLWGRGECAISPLHPEVSASWLLKENPHRACPVRKAVALCQSTERRTGRYVTCGFGRNVKR